MKIQEKLKYLQDHHLDKWLTTKNEIENEMSNKQGTFCLCGHIATGLHEMSCKKFRNKVISETVKKLKYL